MERITDSCVVIAAACSCKATLLYVVGSASPPVLFRRRDLYRPLRLHRLAVSVTRPRSDLSTASVSKPLRRPVTPSDKQDETLSVQTRTGRSLSSLTSSAANTLPVMRRSRAVTDSSPSATAREVTRTEASSTPRDSSHAASTSAPVSKMSRTLVKSVSADKATRPPSFKTASAEHPELVRKQPAVSKSKSTTNVKKQAKSTTDAAADREVSKKETKAPTSVKVP